MAYRLSSKAREDLVGIAADTAQHLSEAAADTVIDGIRERCRLLGRHPFVGRSRDDDLGVGRRSLPIARFIIVYKTSASGVVIDGRRDYPAILRQ